MAFTIPPLLYDFATDTPTLTTPPDGGSWGAVQITGGLLVVGAGGAARFSYFGSSGDPLLLPGTDLSVALKIPNWPTPGSGASNYIWVDTHGQQPGATWDAIRWQVMRQTSGTDQWTIQDVTNGSGADIGAAVSREVAAGDWVGLERVGTTCTMHHLAAADDPNDPADWVEVISRTSSAVQISGMFAVGGYDAAIGVEEIYASGAGGSSPEPNCYRKGESDTEPCVSRRWGGSSFHPPLGA